jgi:hypothetical protein
MEIIILELFLLGIVAWMQWRAYGTTAALLRGQKSVFPVEARYLYRLVTGAFQTRQIEQVDADFVQSTIQSNHNLNYVRFFQLDDNGDRPLFESKPEELKLVGGYFSDPVLCSIQRDVNIYLVRNNNRSTDFKVIQDIVDRHCQVRGGMAESAMGLPLYYGLLGTIIGIVIGCLHISMEGADDASNVVALLQTVALAMSVSGFGLLLTIMNISKQKEANQALEIGKNQFLTFVQSELLPVMRSDVQQSLFTMQRGLNQFNESFQSNLAKFDTSLSTISDNLSLQRSFLTKLDQIGFVQMVKETTGIFEQLGKSADALKGFRHYQESVNTTLGSLESVVNNFQGLYQRTENFEQSLHLIAENIGRQESTYHQILNMLEENAEEVDIRRESLRRIVDGIDSFFRAQYEELSVNTERYNQKLLSVNDLHITKIRESYEHLQLAIAQKTEELKKMSEKEMSMLEETYRSKQSTFDNLGRLPKIEHAVTTMTNRQQNSEVFKELATVLNRLAERLDEAESTRVINWPAVQRLFSRNTQNHSNGKDE